MSREALGELVPVGGGDAIPLVREIVTIGRRESCDISLKFQNVSSIHAELSYKNGYWMVKDLGSRNGIKVNGERITMQRALRPGDEVGIATHKYHIQYHITGGTQQMLEELLSVEEDVFSQSLMEKAGLTKPRRDGDD